jgi:hypothetical protein
MDKTCILVYVKYYCALREGIRQPACRCVAVDVKEYCTLRERVLYRTWRTTAAYVKNTIAYVTAYGGLREVLF